MMTFCRMCMNEHYPVFNEWVCLWILDTGVVFGKNCFDLYPNLEGGMALLSVPEVFTI